MTVFKIEFEFDGQKHSATIWKFLTLDDGKVQFHALDIEPLPEGVREILVYIAKDEGKGFDFNFTPKTFKFIAHVLDAIMQHCDKNGIALYAR
jgi:hypothetical protein